MIDFFETAIEYYLTYPTWDWLAAARIVPSNTTQYTLSNIQDTLTEASGALPYIGCSGPRYNETDAGQGSDDNGRTVISEVWYYNHVLGRPQDGNSIPVNTTYTSTCAKAENAVWYYEPTSSSVRD